VSETFLLSVEEKKVIFHAEKLYKSGEKGSNFVALFVCCIPKTRPSLFPVCYSVLLLILLCVFTLLLYAGCRHFFRTLVCFMLPMDWKSDDGEKR